MPPSRSRMFWRCLKSSKNAARSSPSCRPNSPGRHGLHIRDPDGNAGRFRSSLSGSGSCAVLEWAVSAIPTKTVMAQQSHLFPPPRESVGRGPRSGGGGDHARDAGGCPTPSRTDFRPCDPPPSSSLVRSFGGLDANPPKPLAQVGHPLSRTGRPPLFARTLSRDPPPPFRFKQARCTGGAATVPG